MRGGRERAGVNSGESTRKGRVRPFVINAVIVSMNVAQRSCGMTAIE